MLIADKNQPISSEWVQKVEKVYNGDVESVNFSEVDKNLNLINKKISNLTEGQIRDALTRNNLFRVSWSLVFDLNSIFFMKFRLDSFSSQDFFSKEIG